MRSAAIRYWLPVAAWTAVILTASGASFSAGETGSILDALARLILGRPLAPDTFDALHFLIRKSAHLGEYAILGALAFRALRGERRGFSMRWAAGAVLLAAVVASADEWHQSFVPGRTSTPVDVAIDITGAMLAQAVRRAAERRRGIRS